MSKIKVFLCEHIHPQARKYLEGFAEIVDDWGRLCEADAIINRNLNLNSMILTKAEKLKVIAVHGTGLDGVDLEATKKRGIEVFSTPHMNTDSVAELIVTLVLALERNINSAVRLIDSGEEYPNSPAFLMGNEIGGKVLGLIGTGEIARRAAFILKNGFGMKVCAWSRSFNEKKASELGYDYCESIEAVFEKADIINIGMALTPDTEGIIDYNKLCHAKKDAILINTARGRLIKEEDLVKALSNKILAGAACDVFASEPPMKDNPLLKFDRFIATPHIGANTDEALYRVGMAAVKGIEERLCRTK